LGRNLLREKDRGKRQARTSRRRRLSFLVVDSHGVTRATSLSLETLFVIAFLFLAASVGLGYFFHSYAAARKELSDLQYIKEVAESQRQEIQRLQEQYQGLAERLKQAEVNEARTREMLQREGILPQSFASGARVASREVLPLASRSGRALLTPRDMGRALEALAANLSQMQESVNEIELKVEDLEALGSQAVAYHRAQPIIWPVEGDITSHFGWRRHPITGARDLHQGIDIAAGYWTPVFATGDGVVTFAGYKYGYGRTVIIDHGFGLRTVYAHCVSVKARAGATVRRGDVIAYVGESGTATGPHLHYEIHKDGVAIDPLKFLNTQNEKAQK